MKIEHTKIYTQRKFEIKKLMNKKLKKNEFY